MLTKMSETNAEAVEENNAFEQLNVLLESVEQHPDEQVRNHFRALVYALLDLHHGALQRIIEIVSAQPEGENTLAELERDDLIQAVLLVHDLMPRDLTTRLEAALETARRQLEVYGADVELVGLKNGVARLRLLGSASTANVSTALLKGEIEQAVHEVAPDLLNIEYEDLIASVRPAKLVQIRPRQPAPVETLLPLIRADQVPANELRVVAMGDINLLLCNVAGTIYTFQNACAHENLSLERGFLEGGILTCPWHGYQFDVRQNGRCLTDTRLRLAAVPSRIENGVVKVALPKEV